MLNKLRTFGDCSGLKISMQKSNLFVAGISREDLESIKSVLGFTVGRLPFREWNVSGWPVCLFLQGLERGSFGCVGTSYEEANVLFPKTLWLHGIRWVHQHYLQNTSIWEYIGKKRDSAMMKQMLLIQEKIFAMEGSIQAVGNRMGQWVLEEAKGTGIQAKVKKIGLACAVYYIGRLEMRGYLKGHFQNLMVLCLNPPIHSLFLGDGCCGFCSENLVMCCDLSPGWSCFDVASRWWDLLRICYWSFMINYVCCIPLVNLLLVLLNLGCWALLLGLAAGGGSDLFLLDCCYPCCWFALVLGCCPLVPISIAVDASCCRADMGMMLVVACCC
ncbi:hypothetical protein Acr_21g0004620 [Actinidia rufa]|uniref:Uncharacterized protein n=1 Tax=Actinidia rufa TaxID=165716 RepID=A0A7J0GGB6_9ERIC|nr:hypothetical protein Acr_21g0004620 [Actinidia rufa]